MRGDWTGDEAADARRAVEETVRRAVADPQTVARYRSKVVAVPGSPCAWSSGAVSGRGHGRFWVARANSRDVVMIAHRFGYALEVGVQALFAAAVLGHACDNPLCQRVGAGHVQPSTPRRNRREWAARRALAGGPLTDRRGARGRARALRDAVVSGRELFEVVRAAGMPLGRQHGLWDAEALLVPGRDEAADGRAGVGVVRHDAQVGPMRSRVGCGSG